MIIGDAVGSLDSKEFLRRADASASDRDNPIFPSPVIPNAFNR